MLLCLDYGSRYIGVAATDYEGRIPYRYGVIDQKNTSKVLSDIKDIVEKENIVKVLVGVPMSLEGNETQQTHETLAFIEELQKTLGDIEIEPVDETLTSVEAQQNLRAEGGKKHDEHAEAARLMLVDYLATGI